MQTEILLDIQTIENDERLYEPDEFASRQQAIDNIEFLIIDRLSALTERGEVREWINELRYRAENLKADLHAIDTQIFLSLRNKIVAGCSGQPLIDEISEYIDLSQLLQNDVDYSYDDMDVFFNSLLSNQSVPAETVERESEMVFFQKTPVRIILELIKKANFQPSDVFYDIGSGLGQVAILVNLFAHVTCKGIEFEPSFCNYATNCGVGLNLKNIEFINADARQAGYSQGTVFFLYTPFRGQMLQDVLTRLKDQTANKSIKIFTYGPCTPVVTQQDWLINKSEDSNTEDGFGIFERK